MPTNELCSNDELSLKHEGIYSESEPVDPFYREENIARLKESMEQLKRGQVVEKTLEELRKLVYG